MNQINNIVKNVLPISFNHLGARTRARVSWVRRNLRRTAPLSVSRVRSFTTFEGRRLYAIFQVFAVDHVYGFIYYQLVTSTGSRSLFGLLLLARFMTPCGGTAVPQVK
jgi:hypothetical protein